MSLLSFAQDKLDLICWPKMQEIFRAVERGERKILVRSCNGAGKTTALAAICNWYFSTYDDAIVLTTASSWEQLRRNLWGEIRRQAYNAKLYSAKEIKLTNTSLHGSDKHYMLGISPAVAENAMGFHAPHMLIAVDEATSISRDIIDALMGNLTGSEAQIVMICNPIDMESFPYEAEKSGDWHVITISAFDHPNVDKGNEDIRGAVTRRWVEDRLKAWSYEIAPSKVSHSERSVFEPCENTRSEESREGCRPSERDPSLPSVAQDDMLLKNAIYVKWLNKYYHRTPIAVSRILGEWADLQSEGFIPMEMIRKCIRLTTTSHSERSEESRDQRQCLTGRDSSLDSSGPPFGTPQNDVAANGVRVMGVDIARSGPDSTVFAYFDGDRQLPFETFQHQDTMRTADLIKARYDAGWTLIAIDDTGVGGGVTDRLRQLGVAVHAINFASKPKGYMRERMVDLANARAEMYFCLHDDIQKGIVTLVDDADFHRELASIRLSTSEHTPAIRMEDKDATRQRLGKSPDKADAVALARYALRLPAPVLPGEKLFFF